MINAYTLRDLMHCGADKIIRVPNHHSTLITQHYFDVHYITGLWPAAQPGKQGADIQEQRFKHLVSWKGFRKSSQQELTTHKQPLCTRAGFVLLITFIFIAP